MSQFNHPHSFHSSFSLKTLMPLPARCLLHHHLVPPPPSNSKPLSLKTLTFALIVLKPLLSLSNAKQVLLLVSHYSRLSFVLNICTKLALYLQFIVHFVEIVHIFMFSLILYNRCFHFCEVMLKPLQFQAKRREGSSSWCLAKRGKYAQQVTSAKRGIQLAQRVGKSQKMISQRCAGSVSRQLAQRVSCLFSRLARPAR